MKTFVLALIIVIGLSGCMRRSSYISLQPHTKIASPSVGILTPSSYPKTPFETWNIHPNAVIHLDRTIPNMMRQNIRISVELLESGPSTLDSLLDKKFNDTFEKYNEVLPLTNWQMYNTFERGVNYYKDYVDFVAGLKCGTRVESQNIAEGIGSKAYWTLCPYYDKQGNKKYIRTNYRFYFTFDRTKFQGSDNPSLVRHRFEEIQLQFKKDMKVIFDSMEIYDMDRERMEKEGLLYNKKYMLETESKAKDKSLKCTYIKEIDSFECIGRETGRQCTRKRTEKYIWDCKDK
ncbi:hypothetical protein [Arcobacter sp. FWKO B]|uniref:hypothetical protein n=1 Tax=Arcobacter sp. FWKO B TaxID=2593672 RepID=UPI0018A5F6E9|nr:hypothetical protein [Arcobacter sp. FWKO B]QOG12444.1 hypothetical protein FWKOB_06900 [Arcobacter sp. FWKO B]